MLRAAFALLLAGAACAQPMKVYTEFQRIDPFGNVIPADRAETPREVLSPALARNAWASYFVVLRPPAGGGWYAYVAQNPENAVEVRAYRPVYEKHGELWIPDALEPLPISESRLPDMAPQVPGQTIIPVWLELYVAPGAQVRRTRLEIQLHMGDHWVIYPMELRIQQARVPDTGSGQEQVAAVERPASATAEGPLRDYLCGSRPAANGSARDGAPATIRSAILRNARQDEALARVLEGLIGRETVLADIASRTPVRDPFRFCKSFTPPADRGAEWYQSVRDYLYRTAFVVRPVAETLPPR